MIPLADDSRRPANTPIITISIIAVNLVVFLLELAGGDAFVTRWSLVPADIVHGHRLITLLTAMFMHSGWLHILSNMLFLWVFGPIVEDTMGSRRYLLFYLIGGLVAFLGQIVIDPTSIVPNLGASGAIAAVMGAFLITNAGDRIRTVLWFGIFFTIRPVSALVMIGLWFILQVISVAGVLGTAQAQSGGVAYMAHVAGFIFGFLVGRLFESPRLTIDQDSSAADV